MTQRIPLTNGRFAIVDDEDACVIGATKWQANPANRPAGKYYAVRCSNQTTLYMHRIIMCAPKGVLVDHINGDGLDNRRANLRLATPSQNNASARWVNKSGYRGVHRHCTGYRAQIEFQGRIQRSSVVRTAEEAARLYDAMAAEIFGEFARLNFMPKESAA